MNQRQPRVKSEALRLSAGHPDARCMFGTSACNWPQGGCVLCHLRIENTGVGIKPDDFCAAFGCSGCHDLIDGRTPGMTFGSHDWYFYALRAMKRTQRWWYDHGLLQVAA